MARLTEVVKEQYAAAWSLLSDAATALDIDAWRRTGPGDLVPARLVVHILETADYYVAPDLASFEWGARFGIDWETARPDELPRKATLIAYQSEVQRRCAQWIDHLGDDGLLAPDGVFHDEGMSHLDRALYVLRHTHHHLGELFALLREWGIPRPGWR